MTTWPLVVNQTESVFVVVRTAKSYKFEKSVNNEKVGIVLLRQNSSRRHVVSVALKQIRVDSWPFVVEAERGADFPILFVQNSPRGGSISTAD